MNEVRQLCKRKTTPHYIILEEESNEGLRKRQELWSKDLLRYGINTYIYPYKEYVELEEMLKKISIKSKGNTVYVTGSHNEGCQLAKELGKELAKINSIILINGQSEGVGKNILQAFVEFGINNKMDIHNRLKLYPNPYANNIEWDNSDEFLGALRTFRSELIGETQVIIMFDGGKGTNIEYQLATELGCIIIPVSTDSNSDFMNNVISSQSIIKNIKIYDKVYAGKLESREEITCGDIIRCVKKIMNL